MSLIEVRLRPAGPWRTGHRAGDRERVDTIYHSDALYSAVTHAMNSLGWLEEWLDATARAAGDPAVRLSSLFPFIGKTRLITPPRSVWPPANSGKLYLQSARLVPLELIRGGTFDESRWSADGASECLVPAGAGAPFHVSMRAAAAVDRITGAAEPHRVACLEFASNAGWWGVFEAADKAWEARVKSAFRLLADAGFGGERSRGWGRAGAPQFSDASSLFGNGEANGTWWLLSLYSPGETDVVDWSKGEYSTATRGGWTDSPAGAGAKKQVRMIEEGSVLAAGELRGRAVDVAPDGFAHPVYRSGFALAVRVPVAQALPPLQAAQAATETPIPSRDPVSPLGVLAREGAVVAPAPEQRTETVEEPAALTPEEPAAVPLADARGSEAQVAEEPAAPDAMETPIPSRDPVSPLGVLAREGAVVAPESEQRTETVEEPGSATPEEAVVPLADARGSEAQAAEEPAAPDAMETPIPSRDPVSPLGVLAREEAVAAPESEASIETVEEPGTATPEEAVVPLADARGPETQVAEEPAAPDEVEG